MSAGRAKVCFRQLKKRRGKKYGFVIICASFVDLRQAKLSKLFLIFDVIFSLLNCPSVFCKKNFLTNGRIAFVMGYMQSLREENSA